MALSSRHKQKVVVSQVAKKPAVSQVIKVQVCLRWKTQIILSFIQSLLVPARGHGPRTIWPVGAGTCCVPQHLSVYTLWPPQGIFLRTLRCKNVARNNEAIGLRIVFIFSATPIICANSLLPLNNIKKNGPVAQFSLGQPTTGWPSPDEAKKLHRQVLWSPILIERIQRGNSFSPPIFRIKRIVPSDGIRKAKPLLDISRDTPWRS